jgi:hypothetical protein
VPLAPRKRGKDGGKDGTQYDEMLECQSDELYTETNTHKKEDIGKKREGVGPRSYVGHTTSARSRKESGHVRAHV